MLLVRRFNLFDCFGCVYVVVREIRQVCNRRVGDLTTVDWCALVVWTVYIAAFQW